MTRPYRQVQTIKEQAVSEPIKPSVAPMDGEQFWRKYGHRAGDGCPTEPPSRGILRAPWLAAHEDGDERPSVLCRKCGHSQALHGYERCCAAACLCPGAS